MNFPLWKRPQLVQYCIVLNKTWLDFDVRLLLRAPVERLGERLYLFQAKSCLISNTTRKSRRNSGKLILYGFPIVLVHFLHERSGLRRKLNDRGWFFCWFCGAGTRLVFKRMTFFERDGLKPLEVGDVRSAHGILYLGVYKGKLNHCRIATLISGKWNQFTW